MKFGMLMLLFSLILSACAQTKTTTVQDSLDTVKSTSTTEIINERDIVPIVSKTILSFPNNYEVGTESTKEDKIFVERVYILNTKSQKKIVLEKVSSLAHRPIDDLKKINDNHFSFIITANPHFAQYFEYNLEGEGDIKFPLVDECHMKDIVSKELQEKARIKCYNNPEFGTFEEVLNKLKSIK